MKPTEQSIKDAAALEYREFPTEVAGSMNYNKDVHCFKKRKAFGKGAQWAISQMQSEWAWTVIDFDNQETFPLEDDPVLCFTNDGLHVLQLMKYGTHVANFEWETCFSKPRNKSFPIDFVKQWKNVEPPKETTKGERLSVQTDDCGRPDTDPNYDPRDIDFNI